MIKTITITDCFAQHIGVREYDGIVADIQRWYYGYVYKASWCATSCSYFANEVGMLEAMGGKNENVYSMMEACRKTGKGTFYYKAEIPENYAIRRGTVLFLLHSGTKMTTTSSKHVTTAYEDFTYTGKGYFKALGGNQNDSICVAQYAQSKIYALFVPPYPQDKKQTVKKGVKGEIVKELQQDLNLFGFKDQDGNLLAVDGSCGSRTEFAIKALQEDQGLEVDGSCGPITWSTIDRMLAECKVKKTITMLNCRTGPSKEYPSKKVLPEGKDYLVTRWGDWVYLPLPDGWVNGKYLE